jgi:outer membrane receptor for ferrienterochelin and colicins
MHKQTKAFLSILFLTGVFSYAQETVTDSIKTTQLSEVVVTGQIEPQSIKKSVFNVRVISAEDIKRQAGNNLADVLNQYLNIIVQPNNSTGRSTVSMFGLDSNYLKILVDNVPLVSDTGLGNNVDLTQINLNDIQQIEIIEGSMGVTHGANAVSGIINIITKKSAKHKWEITATAQEETIGNEYALLKDKGRHIQSLRAAHTLNDNWFVSLGANRNNFEGFIDGRGGRDYTNYDVNDPEHNRGYSWLPKEQLFTNALVRYQKGTTRLFYKFDFFNEDINYYDPVVRNSPVGGSIYRTSDDRRYTTQKFYHHLNAVGKLFSRLDYNVSVSHQKQGRDAEQFKYFIQTGQEQDTKKATFQETEVLYSTGTLSNFFTNKKVDVQVGYEAVNTYGFSAALSGLFDPNNGGTNQKKRLENYDAFTAAEISLSDRFSIRPGFRYSFQSKFNDQWAASLGLRQLFSQGYEARLSLGRSYRTPNYDELYTYFVDVNHNLQGNPELVPEVGNSAELSAKKVTSFESGLLLTNTLSSSYIDVNDRIELAVVNASPLEYRYINISKYHMWNIFSTTHQLNYKDWQFKAGASLSGISRQIDNGMAVSDDKFLYTFQANINVGYTVPRWNTIFSAYYKYNGKQRQFVDNNSLSSPGFELQEIASFGLLDASVKKTFLNNRFEATVGARNLLDVVNVRSTVANGASAHAAGTTNILMGYGRSYFFKLSYNLNF